MKAVFRLGLLFYLLLVLFTSFLEKFLVDLLFPLLSWELLLKNSSRFVQLIINFQCFNYECLVYSFDVVSLFSYIFLPETSSVISSLLMYDNSVGDIIKRV